MEQPAETLTRDRVVLRRYRPDDLDALERAISESLEHLLPWMPWAAAHSRESVADYLDRAQLDWESGAAFNYAITTEGVLVGSCSMMRRIGPGGLEIGYWLHSGWTGRGLATSAAAALTREAFRLTGTTHVEIHYDEANRPSGAVPGRLGYTLVSRTGRAERLEQAGRDGLTAPRPAPADSGVDVVTRIGREAAEALG
ncbi:GNAT family N-acetyltransferase [Streptacidiphilus sp. PB12-B1b]|uniref:GNAT family N-acetyltransferase n=1 Tax=Streptacidiphilus sp. PB12-B1b TaxID=2705012 RepID=UPI0015FC92A9|nr:GNAT family N-acetyltransferase [Streptacidiphilus sp. PB12-B1b]QMU75887.1 GNAT family N-acetyltransferase [Streptacidiphilus sp. PB12-B1b]